jgi:REP element-mobilizing transposase RayT
MGPLKMKYDPRKHHRRSIRLQGYDYSQQGAYFITLVTQHRECSFGAIGEDGIRLSPIGQTTQDFWRQIPAHFPNVALDEFVVMPNHLHGIIVMRVERIQPKQTEPPVGVEYIQPLPNIQPRPPQRNAYQHIIPRSIGSIVRSYKASVTRWCRRAGYADFQWQRDYYEHIIRDEHALERIRHYIIGNPFHWATDDENPAGKLCLL